MLTKRFDTSVHVKASLLSNGVALSADAIENFGEPYLEKRRAYGNQDPLDIKPKKIPQELYVLPGNLITAVNVKYDSPWNLIHENESFFVQYQKNYKVPVTFPLRPKFYDTKLNSGLNVSQIITLYGGSSLGIFAYGSCSLFNMRKPCQFCSLVPNRKKDCDYVEKVAPSQLREALEIALNDDTVKINQVMINGGNMPDLDNNFNYYLELIRVAEEVIQKLDKKVELHLIVFPPENLELLEKLHGLNIGLAMNVEVFSGDLFKKICPGKEYLVGHDHILKALIEAVNVLGKGNVYTIIVGGLEPLDRLEQGVNYLASLGICPVVNVLHTDPETPLENYLNPDEKYILRAGKILQKTYKKHDYKAFYENCGRNAIDYEAMLQLF